MQNRTIMLSNFKFFKIDHAKMLKKLTFYILGTISRVEIRNHR